MIAYSLSEILKGKEDQLAKGLELERDIKSLGIKLYSELQPREAQELVAKFVYHTNAIEGSKLSFDYTLAALSRKGFFPFSSSRYQNWRSSKNGTRR